MSDGPDDPPLQSSPALECRSCDLGFGLKRLILHTGTDERFGSLCFTCETKLTAVLEEVDGGSQDGESCLICDHEGPFALPELHLTTDPDGEAAVEYEFEVTDATPRFCSGHLRELIDRPRLADPHDLLDEL